MTGFRSVAASSGPATGIASGSPPQSKGIPPPWGIAAAGVSAVQLAALPSPTTLVGLDTSVALASSGNGCEHWPSGLPAFSTALLVVPASAPVLEAAPASPAAP